MTPSNTAPKSKPDVTQAATPASAAFEKALNTFIRSTKESMDSARRCAEMALDHYAEHGNTIWCQRFYDAMPQNWTRKQAYLRWLVAFAPITMENKKFVKDTRENASVLDVEGAKKLPFWDFAPELEIIDFSAEDITKALGQMIKRFNNTKRYSATDEEAILVLKKLEGIYTGITGEAPPANENTTDSDQSAAVTGTHG